LPNTDLTKNHLINWTHSHVASRFDITVGVDYASDVNLIMKLLVEAVDQHPLILKTPAPMARFIDYGDSSINFAVLFWSEEVFRIDNIKSEVRVKIFELFLTHQVTIPFPQRVIHMKT
jgi:small-conductance mechanosensitive channel